MNKLIEMHGKGYCDGVSNIISIKIGKMLARGDLMDPGTRALVLHMALHKLLPSVLKARKDGWWGTESIFWGFYEPKLFTLTKVPRAKGFAGSKSCHYMVGFCQDREWAHELKGPLKAGESPCACSACRVLIQIW